MSASLWRRSERREGGRCGADQEDLRPEGEHFYAEHPNSEVRRRKDALRIK